MPEALVPPGRNEAVKAVELMTSEPERTQAGNADAAEPKMHVTSRKT
jgi:hypothetical protein